MGCGCSSNGRFCKWYYFAIYLGHPLFAKFTEPYGIIGDSRNNLYISEHIIGAVRRIDGISNYVSTFAIGFFSPELMVFDNYGNIILCDPDK